MLKKRLNSVVLHKKKKDVKKKSIVITKAKSVSNTKAKSASNTKLLLKRKKNNKKQRVLSIV